MNVASNEHDLINFLAQAEELSSDHPVVISKFILGAKEIEMDAVAQNGRIINYCISEHVENAGVHSGDATLVVPAQNLYIETMKRVKKTTMKIADALQITGPFNIQYLCKDNEIKVIECNLRASRSFPFVSKTLNVNFIDLATKAMMGINVERANFSLDNFDYVCVKAPMFSFTRLQGADPVLRVEMASTGEVACFGDSKHEAFLKALISTGFKVPNLKNRKRILLSCGPIKSKVAFLEPAKSLKKMGFELYASEGTHQFLMDNGLQTTLLYKPSSGQKPSIIEYLSSGELDLVVNVPENLTRSEQTNGYKIRRTAVDFGVPLISNLQLARLLVRALEKLPDMKALQVRPWRSYLATAETQHAYLNY